MFGNNTEIRELRSIEINPPPIIRENDFKIKTLLKEKY